jgi:hypothetical protein
VMEEAGVDLAILAESACIVYEPELEMTP